MIEVSISGLFITIVVIPFVLCGLAALWRRYGEAREETVARRETMRCRYCGTPFPHDLSLKTEHCPRCRANNLAGRDRRLG